MAAMFKPKVPVAPPDAPEPEPLPVPDSAPVIKEARKNASIQRQRSGMQSTVLSRRSSRETLGG
ncbi:MAG: hypothetical protein AB8B85_16840 [Paracoccaceae bacterium]